MSDAMHMLDANNAALATRVQELAQENAALHADVAALCAMLRGVRYTQTVGELHRIRVTCDEMDARWSNGSANHA